MLGNGGKVRAVLCACLTGLLVATASSVVQDQAFPNDNDGLLDVGEAQGFRLTLLLRRDILTSLNEALRISMGQAYS